MSEEITSEKLGKTDKWSVSVFVRCFALLKSFSGGRNHLVGPAFEIFVKARDARLLAGSSVEILAKASLYTASKASGDRDKLTLKDLCPGKRNDKASNYMRRSVMYMAQKLKPFCPGRVVPLTADDFVVNFAAKMSLPSEVVGLASEMSKVFSPSELSGTGPSVAAACLHVAANVSGRRISMSEVARATSVSLPTVSNRVRELKKVLAKGAEDPEETLTPPQRRT